MALASESWNYDREALCPAVASDAGADALKNPTLSRREETSLVFEHDL
jgi:hypothetical protein